MHHATKNCMIVKEYFLEVYSWRIMLSKYMHVLDEIWQEKLRSLEIKCFGKQVDFLARLGSLPNLLQYAPNTNTHRQHSPLWSEQNLNTFFA